MAVSGKTSGSERGRGCINSDSVVSTEKASGREIQHDSG